jgi:DNA-directed RNA polymerase specialized sigma24 family protein
MQEVRPGSSLEDGQIATWEMLEPVVRRRFAEARVAFVDTDVDDCRDEVFRRIEAKLRRQEFLVDLAPMPRPELRDLRTQVVLPSARQVSFRFEISDPDSVSRGFKIRLRAGEEVQWEEEGVVEQFDSMNGRLLVSVSANRLRHGGAYCLGLYRAGAESSFAGQEFSAVRVEALHLLQSGPYAVIGHHPDLTAGRRYCARICDMADGALLEAAAGVLCDSAGCLPIHLGYDRLKHDRNARVEICPEGAPGQSYFCCVRAVLHEDWKGRRGYVNQVARNVAWERVRTMARYPQVSLDEEFGSAARPRPDGERQSLANLLSQRAVNGAMVLIRRLPAALQKQMIEQYVEGRSWADIAARHGITEAKAKQDTSRAFAEISKAIAPEPTANHGEVVKWLKEMLSHILEF